MSIFINFAKRLGASEFEAAFPKQRDGDRLVVEGDEATYREGNWIKAGDYQVGDSDYSRENINWMKGVLLKMFFDHEDHVVTDEGLRGEEYTPKFYAIAVAELEKDGIINVYSTASANFAGEFTSCELLERSVALDKLLEKAITPVLAEAKALSAELVKGRSK